ncbi:hypothetical protein NQ665_18755, partial [Acinetobacter baumannii]|nr:hypothetical protein [Acinetobacter baumannii]
MGFLKMALRHAGFEQVPIISLNAVGLEGQPGFKVNLKFLNRALMALIYGDLFMRVVYRTRPYEKVQGAVNKLYNNWNEKAKRNLINGSKKEFKNNLTSIIKEFDNIELVDINKPKVGLVGEILVKFHPTANNNIVGTI